jgi:hypothetical protein
MRTWLLRAAALLAVLALAGCSREAAQPPPDETRLGEKTDVDVAGWLKLPRPALAKLSQEWASAVKNDLDAARKSPEAVELLPRLQPPVRVPVFREAKFSAAAGFSLPPYLKPGKPDAFVALHLARHGDTQAALRLAGGDAALRARIEALRYEREFPAEWTRLVGLVLASSQLKLAGGDVDAATRLVRVHEQLRKVLGPKARQGALGSVLLPTGKRALTLAAKAWRAPDVKKIALADDVDQALGEWGAVPGPSLGLLPGAGKDELVGVLGGPVGGRAVVLQKPEEMARALDLMTLPLRTEALAVLAVFLDATDRVRLIQLTYRAKIEDVLPDTIHLAFHLDEMGLPLKSESGDASLHTQTFVSGPLAFEAARSNRSNALGGWVRVQAAEPPPPAGPAHDLRVFGPVDLGRGYEANRVALDPTTAGPAARVSGPQALRLLTAGLALPAPAEAVLEREKDFDLLAALRMVWGPEQNTKALADLLPALWRTYGDAPGVPTDDARGAYLCFTWQDKATRLQLRLPFDEKGPVLLVEDASGKDQRAARAEEARKRDAAERAARLAAGKPDVRLRRSPGAVNGIASLEGLRLGQPKSEAAALLPNNKSYRCRDLPGLTTLVVLTNPLNASPYWARQILVRYDDNKVAEIRVRYQEGLARAKKSQTLLATLGKGKAGAPQALPPAWLALWTDLPRNRAQAVQLRWEDDLTVCTYQKDSGGTEVVWTDRAAGGRLGPLAWVKSGVPGCKLGDTAKAVRKVLNDPFAHSRGAEVYRQPADSPFEMALVWFTDGKASRILGVHRARPGNKEKEALRALNQAWGSAIDELGFICRQEGERGSVQASYYWHDDRTRVETFVQTTEQGPRLMTEFRAWSAGTGGPAPPVAAGAEKGNGRKG